MHLNRSIKGDRHRSISNFRITILLFAVQKPTCAGTAHDDDPSVALGGGLNMFAPAPKIGKDPLI